MSFRHSFLSGNASEPSGGGDALVVLAAGSFLDQETINVGVAWAFNFSNAAGNGSWQQLPISRWALRAASVCVWPCPSELCVGAASAFPSCSLV